nr:MAG TPA: hypothetical protein [Caudoviricetes sp.]
MALQQFAAEQRQNANASTAPVGQPVVEIEIRDVVIQTGGEIIPTYEGEYEVTPRVDEPVVLHTKAKRMNDDVTVKKIPQYEVSNAAGGKTLTIGDVEYG